MFSVLETIFLLRRGELSSVVAEPLSVGFYDYKAPPFFLQPLSFSPEGKILARLIHRTSLPDDAFHPPGLIL